MFISHLHIQQIHSSISIHRASSSTIATALITSKVITQNKEADSHSVIWVVCPPPPCNFLSKQNLLSAHEVRRYTYCIFSGLCDFQRDVPHYGIHQRGVRISWRWETEPSKHTADTNAYIWKVRKWYTLGEHTIIDYIYVSHPIQQEAKSAVWLSHTHTCTCADWEVYMWLRLDGWCLPGFLNCNVISHSALGLMGHAVEYLVWSESISGPQWESRTCE